MMLPRRVGICCVSRCGSLECSLDRMSELCEGEHGAVDVRDCEDRPLRDDEARSSDIA